MKLKHHTSKDRNRVYLVDEDKQIGEIVYTYLNDHIIDITHTEIDSNYRGQNLGQKLIDELVSYARNHHLKAKASCPYVAKVFESSNNYNDIIA